MISTDSVQNLIGSNAYGPDGDKIGTIGQIYLDNDSGRPEWATVKTGFFGTKESFVPLQDAELSTEGVRLPYGKDRIKGAPSIDADRDASPEEESALFDYYGIAAGTGAGTDMGSGTSVGRDHEDTTGYDTSGYDTSGPTTDDAMTRSEERVHTGRETHETGRAKLRKYVVTDHQQVVVPVTREEAHIEREPITDANRGAATSGPELSDEEHEVVLKEERPTVHKETVPVERVRLSKDQVTDDRNVDVDVHEERIDADTDRR